MNVPNWMKSKARKAREATAAEEVRQKEIARREELQRKYEAEFAAANTPEKLQETGTAMLINLIKNYKGVFVRDSGGWRNAKWLMGNIVFNATLFTVSYREGLSETYLFCVPSLQQETVLNVLRDRLKKIEANPMPLEKMKPVEAELRKIYADIEQRKKGLADKKAIEELDCEYDRRRRDLFVRLAQEALEKNK